jgi:hypothetical protein
VDLTWASGSGQTGYVIARLTDGLWTVPPGGLLGPAETSYRDATVIPGLHCYVVLPLGTNPQALSDLECAQVGFHTPTGAPRGFTLRLNQSSTASLTWDAPIDSPPGAPTDGYLLVTLGSDARSLSATETSAALPMLGAGCYVLGTTSGGAITGYSDILCGIPGLATVSSAAAGTR